MKKLISVIVCMLVLVLCLTACGQGAPSTSDGQSLANGGVLVLRVNPEIAVEYDANGVVTGVIARNDDALAIIDGCGGLIGQPAREAVTALVTAIGEAGYFVEEFEGEGRRITLEIEPGSSLPNATFVNDLVEDIRNCVSSHDWTTPLVVEAEAGYGVTDYVDTDYGPDNDGYTDYDDTDYGVYNDGITDYDHNINDDTDYGPDNDGVTDYDGTDYADNTDYGVNADGNTDYNDTDYGVYADGVTDYTDYGTSSGGSSKTTGSNKTTGSTDYDATDYGDSTTDYDDGTTDYDDGDSKYD